MKPIENNSVFPPQVAPSGLATQIAQWLGRVWSTCIGQLKALIERIKRCIHPHLDEPKPKKPKKKDDLALLSEFPSLKLPPVSSPVRSVLFEPKPVKLEPLTDILYTEADFSLAELFEEPARQIEHKPANSTPLIQEIETQKGKAIDQLSVAKEEKKQEKDSVVPTFKRRYAKLSSEKDHTGPKLNPIHSVLGKAVSSIEGFKIIEVKADGNCLLLSVLKGLELQHPALMKYQKKEESTDYKYTAQDLRLLGIEFVKHQIDKCDTFAQEVLGYLDTDRKEHNEAVENHVNFSLEHELAKLATAFEEKKIKPEEYTQQVQEVKNKYQQLKEKLRIHTDEAFLNCLVKNGFFCSTLHLFALSAHFQIPIHIHEQAGVAQHNIQIFNPTQSAQEPIHLYRINNNHYQFLLKELPKAAEA